MKGEKETAPQKRRGRRERQMGREGERERGREGDHPLTPSPPLPLMGICVLYASVARGLFIISCFLFSVSFAYAATDGPTAKFTIARLKYSGGGDWYNDPSVIPNLLDFLREHTAIVAASDEARVAIADEDFFSYPMMYMTGHGNIFFSEDEARRLRTYLEHGGFLYADDDYGMDRAFRREIKKVFPDKELLEIPLSHGIFHSPFDFPQGLPKIHKHDGGPPQAFGIFHEKRLVVFYTFETNISDGWASPEVHHDPPEVREAALKMGTNIVVWALTH